MPRFVTLEDAAELTGASLDALCRWVRREWVDTYYALRVGWMVPLEQVQELASVPLRRRVLGARRRIGQRNRRSLTERCERQKREVVRDAERYRYRERLA